LTTPLQQTAQSSTIERRWRVVNLSRGSLLASQLELADTSAKRNKGLLGRDALEPGGGLWIVPCQSVHMFFMRFALDLVYVDGKGRVRKAQQNVLPWRISVCLTAHAILELPVGTIAASQTRKGDQLEFAELTNADPALAVEAAEAENPVKLESPVCGSEM